MRKSFSRLIFPPSIFDWVIIVLLWCGSND
nr:MAG TPA: hypothetical protein [Caudoviricetes sp.]